MNVTGEKQNTNNILRNENTQPPLPPASNLNTCPLVLLFCLWFLKLDRGLYVFLYENDGPSLLQK